MTGSKSYSLAFLRFIGIKYGFNFEKEYLKYRIEKHGSNENNFSEMFDVYVMEIERICRVPHELFLSKSRERNLVFLRHILVYICLKNHNVSLQVLGLVLGGKNHATIINARNQAEDLILTQDYIFMTIYNQLKHLIKEDNPRAIKKEKNEHKF